MGGLRTTSYRVTARRVDGGFSVTSHKSAVEAYCKFIQVRGTNEAYVEDSSVRRISENQLIEMMAIEAN